jgi:hypothetical protein
MPALSSKRFNNLQLTTNKPISNRGMIRNPHGPSKYSVIDSPLLWRVLVNGSLRKLWFLPQAA